MRLCDLITNLRKDLEKADKNISNLKLDIIELKKK